MIKDIKYPSEMITNCEQSFILNRLLPDWLFIHSFISHDARKHHRDY